MNKGIITKIERKFMIVKTEENNIERIKFRSQVNVGETIEFSKKDIYKGFSNISYRQIGTSVSMFIILVVVSALFLNQNTEAESIAEISYDVNPGFSIFIDEDLNVLKIETMTDTSQALLDFKYKGQPLSTVFNRLTETVIKNGYLNPEDPILIGYYPISDLAPDVFNQLVSDSNWAMGNVVLTFEITKEEYEAAQKASLTIGRYKLKNWLANHHIEITEDNDFIKNAYKVLEPYLEKVDDFYPIDHIELINDEEEVTETYTEEENEAPITDEAVIEDASDEEASEEVVDEVAEDTSAHEAALAAQQEKISTQKYVVKDAYQEYLKEKDVCQDYESKMAIEESAIESETKDLNILQKNETEYYEIIGAYEAERVDILTTLEVRDQEISVAQNEKQAAIDQTSSEQQQVKDLKSEASRISSAASSALNQQAEITKQEINDWLNYYNGLIGSQEILDVLPGAFEEEIASLNNMITIINQKSGTLSSANENFTSFINAYNSAYSLYKSRMATSNNLYDQASSLQSEIDKVISAAEATYNQVVLEINEKYDVYINRLAVIDQNIEVSKETPERLKTLIAEFKNRIKTHEDLLNELKDLYAQAINRKNNAYTFYLQQLEILNNLENEVIDE
ncbi:MAG: anti-sigma factor domain-containing protein [Clostridia bacterium]|nr:anti-sigma factor domain-containing protein [Clostridia bacterium]